MPGPLLAVDAPFLLYRSFFALPESIVGVDGHPVGALLGATNAVLRIAADRGPRAIVFCFGAEAAAYRVKLYPPYHAHRPPVPDALAWQIETAPDLFGALGWSCESDPALEADDLLHSLALEEAARGGRALILTGDRDMYQCAAERIGLLYLKMGAGGTEEIDAAEVERRYGIPPALVPDFIALRGDPSDGLPGAPGIGAKTAASLLQRHGSLEAVLEAAGEERPKIATALRECAADLRSFREIAALRQVALSLPPDRPTSLDGGAEAARRYGMNALARRLDTARALSDL